MLQQNREFFVWVNSLLEALFLVDTQSWKIWQESWTYLKKSCYLETPDLRLYLVMSCAWHNHAQLYVYIYISIYMYVDTWSALIYGVHIICIYLYVTHCDKETNGLLPKWPLEIQGIIQSYLVSRRLCSCGTEFHSSEIWVVRHATPTLATLFLFGVWLVVGSWMWGSLFRIF